MPGHYFHEHEADERVRLYLANREVVLHLIYPVFDGQICTPFESFDFTLHATAETTLGGTQRSTVDREHALAVGIDFLFAPAFVGVAIVRIDWGSAEGQTRLLASGRT